MDRPVDRLSDPLSDRAGAGGGFCTPGHTSDVTSDVTAVSWQERLWPSLWLAPVVPLLGAGFGLVTAPFGGGVAVTVAVLATLVLGGMLLTTTTVVAVEGGTP